jgi:hypothetical protein
MTEAERSVALDSQRNPQFLFFLEIIRQPVTPKHPIWARLLPISRQDIRTGVPSHLSLDESLSVGDYFEAVRSFLQGAGRNAIAAALEQRGAATSEPHVYRVFLAKHGEYYHPARVETDGEETLFHWVVNTAVSPAGKSLLWREFEILKRLSREFPQSYLPEVYAASEADVGHGRLVALFIGEWFFGYHEFHLTLDSPDSEPVLVLWDPENGRTRLESDQAATIYYQVARILTHYFNLTTFEAIGNWHHAAGDFVVKVIGDRLEVRLITVRDYRPLFRSQQAAGREIPKVEALLQALLIFLLNLGLRNRLDRLDGTGDLAWSDPVAVEATVAGVLAGLGNKSAPCALPLPLDQLFKHYLAACSADDLQDLCNGIASTFGTEAPFVKARLKEHVRSLIHAIKRV